VTAGGAAAEGGAAGLFLVPVRAGWRAAVDRQRSAEHRTTSIAAARQAASCQRQQDQGPCDRSTGQRHTAPAYTELTMSTSPAVRLTAGRPGLPPPCTSASVVLTRSHTYIRIRLSKKLTAVATYTTNEMQNRQGSKNPGFFKKPNPLGFLGGFIGFLDKQEKIGKIIQKLSNLKP